MRKSFATLATPRSAPRETTSTTALAPGSAGRTEKIRTITLNDIRVGAYLKWEAAGKPDGDGSRFWLEAEKELSRGKCF